MSEAVETNPINDLINHSLNQDYNKANQVFGDLVGQKLDIALEQEKIKMANAVFNNETEEDDDVEVGDDQLEFDLEPEDTEGTEEDGAADDSETSESDSDTESNSEEEI